MSDDPRRYLPAPPSASTSRRLQRHTSNDNDNQDISWLDFLRTAGGTVAPERSSSTDRKRRRHAGSSPERRSIPHHPAYNGQRFSGRDAAGSTLESAIDLTTPPRQRPQIPPRMSTSGSNENLRNAARLPSRPTGGNFRASFSGSDIVLPSWQADAEVSRCPVCQTEFSFWYRKHHCRKCGRVVCAACSPHRITIPRQYIVQPPNSSDVERSPTSPTRSQYSRNLGGGEVVRVCNPCVPDPWMPDAAPDVASRGIAEERSGRRSVDAAQRPGRYRTIQSPPSLEPGRSRAHPQYPTGSFSRSLPQGQTYAVRDQYSRPPPPPPPNQPQTITHRNLQNAIHHSPPPLLPSTRPPLASPPPARPRREVREEDECPVCGLELLPGEAERENHIRDCISRRFSSTPSSSSMPPATGPIAPPRTSSMTAQTSRPAIAPSTSAPVGTPMDAANRSRATSYRPRGMAIYRATEKDCVTEDGEAQECVICLVEFQPGDEMGRMECLCKFHRACIRSWWDTKGTGVCPTHMLHE